MNVYIQKEESQENQQIENLLLKEGFIQVQHQLQQLRKFQVKLNQIQKSRMRDKYQSMFRAIIIKLLNEYLLSTQPPPNILQLTPDFFDQTKMKSFIKYLKDNHLNLCSKYNLKQVLNSEYLQSLICLQKDRYLAQSRELVENLSLLKQKQKQLVNVGNRRAGVDMKKLEVYDVLLYNSQLRWKSLNPQQNTRHKAILKQTDKATLSLQQQLAMLKQKEMLMKKIVQNGGWGLITKIKQLVKQTQKC